MLSLKKILRTTKLRSSLEKQGGNGKDNSNSSSSTVKTVINEEYKEAFRTKSYTEISDKIQRQLETRIIVESSSPPPEYLVEPRHEITSKHHHFLTDYFDTSLEAGRICESILQKIHQIRIDYEAIRSVIERDNQHTRLFKSLASFALHGNPFAAMTPQKFHDLHQNHQHFLHQLTSKRAKTKRQKKFTRFIKRAMASIGCGALALALLLLAVHGMAGVVAAPVLVVSSAVLFANREKQESKRQEQGGMEAQLDAAARGVYILINDFDTMSRLVQRLHDEMEHRKLAAGVCVRKGKKEALKELVRQFQMHHFDFLQQLEELEKQICLCVLDINRSRRLLIQQLDK